MPQKYEKVQLCQHYVAQKIYNILSILTLIFYFKSSGSDFFQIIENWSEAYQIGNCCENDALFGGAWLKEISLHIYFE